MPHAPTTITQVGIVLLLVLPGAMYQFVRERARGPAPGHKDLGERIFRAVTVGICLNALYVLLAGPYVVHFVYDRRHGWLTGAVDHPRLAALTATLLFVVVPAGAAWLVSRLSARGNSSTYDPTPTAWDNAFMHRSPCLVRARLKSGCWVAGWYGDKSYASSYPETADVYLQTAWAISRNGKLEGSLEQSGGIYIRMDDVECLDFIEAPPASEDGVVSDQSTTTV